MNYRVLVSLVVIGVIATVAGGATFALFSDTETSSGNTFTAGALDLKIDWNETYNGEPVESQSFTDNPGPIFDLQDVKPGDHGEATVSLHVFDNPAFVNMTLDQTANFENGCTEPESLVDNSCADPGSGEGELGEHLYFMVWDDDGDNEFQSDEQVFFNGTAEELDQQGTIALDGDSETSGVQPFENSTTQYVGIKWNVPRDTGNVIQTDSKEFNFTFYAEQARHNDGATGEPQTEPPVTPPAEPQNETVENVTINVMKHICDEDIQNTTEFNQVDGPDAGNTTEFHDKVLACPTVVQEGDDYANNSVNFGDKEDFDFMVESLSGTQDISDATFVQQKLNESDIGIDVNGDGDMTDALDTSLYSYDGVVDGLVNVTESHAPNNTRPGALEFTPDAIATNDDESALLENKDDVFANDSVIELNTTQDTGDNVITLHVYNFQEEQQVTICHYPPGNPQNPQTITVGQSAVNAHIQQHGDTLGPCENNDNQTNGNTTTPPTTGQPQDEDTYYQADLVGGQPIQNLSNSTYSSEDRLVRFIQGEPGNPVATDSEPDQVLSASGGPDCVDSQPFEQNLTEDTLTAEFQVHNSSECSDLEMSLVSYVKPFPGWIEERAGEQIVFDNETDTFDAGNHSMTIDIPDVNNP